MTEAKQQVVFLICSLGGGGAERAVHDLVHHLDRDIFEPAIIYQLHQGEDFFQYDPSIRRICLEDAKKMTVQGKLSGRYLLSKLMDFTYRAIRFAYRRTIRKLLISKKGNNYISGYKSEINIIDINEWIKNIWDSIIVLRNVLATFRKDCIFFVVDYNLASWFWLSNYPLHLKWYSWMHCIYSQQLNTYPESEKAIVNWSYLNAARDSDGVIFPSEGCRRDLLKFRIDPSAIQVIPNFIDCELIRSSINFPVPKIIEQNAGKTIFVHVARFYPEKNHSLLIEACEILKEKYENFVVICLGRGPLFNEIQEQIIIKGLNDHVILVGEVDNPYIYMKNARSLVLTSLHESFSLVLIEALLCGTTAIAVDCPTGPREILKDGEYGLLTPMGDPAALADAMLKIACNDNLYNDYVQKGVSRAEEFDIKNMIQIWSKLIMDI